MDWLFRYVVMLPLTLSAGRSRGWKIVGFVAQFAWMFPAVLLSLAPMVLLITARQALDSWGGEF